MVSTLRRRVQLLPVREALAKPFLLRKSSHAGSPTFAAVSARGVFTDSAGPARSAAERLHVTKEVFAVSMGIRRW